jgi:hypothetical protein
MPELNAVNAPLFSVWSLSKNIHLDKVLQIYTIILNSYTNHKLSLIKQSNPYIKQVFPMFLSPTGGVDRLLLWAEFTFLVSDIYELLENVLPLLGFYSD